MLPKLITAADNRITNAWPVKQAIGRLSKPIATITFDDFPRSAWTTGGSILESHGARGTFFVSAAFAPENLRKRPAPWLKGLRFYELDDLAAAYAQGHEIGCHTFDHVNAPLQTNRELEHSIERNAEFVSNLLGDVIMTSFAFPHGAVNVRTKRLASKHFAACRGTWPGLNSGVIDVSLLKCVDLTLLINNKYQLSRLIDQATARNAWIIFCAHDVEDRPSPWGCTPEYFRSVVSELVAKDVEILPLKSALARVVFG